MSKGGAREGAGRKAKPKIEQRADKGVASAVLSSIDENAYWRQLLRTDVPVHQLHTLSLAERAQIEETLEYLTNRRDGKPAQGVFVGDTRESAVDLDFGNLVMPASPASHSKPGTARKPN